MSNTETIKFTLFPDWSEWITERNETFIVPTDMKFNDSHKLAVILYSILMFIATFGNIWVLIKLKKSRKSRTNRMLKHLAFADLFVALFMMSTEIFWASTVAWWFGDIACRIAAFFKTFGLYQSSFVLVCIAIDRYYAVVKPLSVADSYYRGNRILIVAWIFSVICSLPQIVVFRVQHHPIATWYEQCSTFNSFPTKSQELAYCIFSMTIMYTLPLIIILYCYASIAKEIFKRASNQNEGDLRRSTLGFLGKAKNRTFKMTVTIILAFFICWTPYYVMALWYWLDASSAERLDNRIQKGLFLFACANSCINPLVYGVYQRAGCGQKNSRTSHNTCTTELRQIRTVSNTIHS